MTNAFYSSPVDLVAVTKALSADINTIDAAVDTAFDKLPTEVQLKSGTTGYAVDTGTVNAYAIALPYAPASYTDGLYISFRVLNTNTITTPTINVNGLGVKSIRKANGSELNIGDLYAGAGVDARYSTATGYFHITGSAGVGAKGDTGAGITPQAVGFTLTGGTTPKTLTVALDASVSGTNTGDQGTIPNVVVVTTTGTWTCPAGVIRAKVTVVGGGGGASNYSASQSGVGGGGGGAAIKWLTVVPGAIYTATVGTGGAGGAAGGNNAGIAGATSSFAGGVITTVSATGGAGGNAVGSDSAGGIGSNGDLNIPGGTGVSSTLNSNTPSATGGSTIFAGSTPMGIAGRGYGAGGGGIWGDFGGAAGAAGVIIIEY